MAVDDVQEIEALAELGIAAGRPQGLHCQSETRQPAITASELQVASRWQVVCNVLQEDLQDLFVWKAAASGWCSLGLECTTTCHDGPVLASVLQLMSRRPRKEASTRCSPSS